MNQEQEQQEYLDWKHLDSRRTKLLRWITALATVVAVVVCMTVTQVDMSPARRAFVMVIAIALSVMSILMVAVVTAEKGRRLRAFVWVISAGATIIGAFLLYGWTINWEL